MKLRWIKWYPVQWLHSTAREEMTVEERATFHDFVCLAAISQKPGEFKFINIRSLARQLNTPAEIVERTLRVCKASRRVQVKKISEGMVCRICKWHIYQPPTQMDMVNHKSKKKDLRLTLREDKIREESKRLTDSLDAIALSNKGSKYSNSLLYSNKTCSEKYSELASFLESKIKEKLPRHRFSGSYLENWANTFRIMIEKKEATEDEIKKLIIWIFDISDFWYKNILSADKLRKQFGRLWAESGLQRKEEEEKKYREWLKK